MCVSVHVCVGGGVCVVGLGVSMPILVPSSEKQRNKYGIFGSDFKKEKKHPGQDPLSV